MTEFSPSGSTAALRREAKLPKRTRQAHWRTVYAALRLAHRWFGALLGLGLALLGLSGTFLLWKPWWTTVSQVPRPATAEETLAIVTSADAMGAQKVVLPSPEFGVAKVDLGDGAGAYLDHHGNLLARWASNWDRPETLLLDFHEHLLMGHDGKLIGGWLALCAILFIVTGFILWWPTRRSFRLRGLPPRTTRPAIIRHHRDLGVVLALPLLLAAGTGALMALKPLQEAIMNPLSPVAAITAYEAKPLPVQPMPIDWAAVLGRAATTFPDAELREISWPKSTNDSVRLRLRRPSEWHPNGRSSVWLSGDGSQIMARDALQAPLAVRARHSLYPLHAAQLTGSAMSLPLRLALTLAGLGLTMLGSLTAFSFWRNQISASTAHLGSKPNQALDN